MNDKIQESGWQVIYKTKSHAKARKEMNNAMELSKFRILSKIKKIDNYYFVFKEISKTQTLIAQLKNLKNYLK